MRYLFFLLFNTLLLAGCSSPEKEGSEHFGPHLGEEDCHACEEETQE